jgi:hypothetical protein
MMLERLWRWLVARPAPKAIEEFRQATDRVSEESRLLRKQLEACTWDDIARGITQEGHRRRNGRSGGDS